MKKITALVAAILLIAGSALAWIECESRPVGGASDSQTYDFLETFDSTGYDNIGWTEDGGTPDEDYTSVVLEGEQSLLLDSRGTSTGQSLYRNYTMQSADATLVVRFRIKCNSLPATGAPDSFLIKFTSTSPTTRGQILLTDDHKLVAAPVGGTAVETTNSIQEGVEYYIWITHKRSISGDGTNSVAFNTTFTRPSSGDNYAISSNGTATSAPARYYIGAGYSSGGTNYSQTCIIDQVMTWEE